MDKSLWIEQIDTAWLSHLKAQVKLKDSTDKLVSVPVTIRKPDPDFQMETYPCITVYNVTYTRNSLLRNNNNLVFVSQDSAATVYEEQAKPFVFLYQVDFWSKLQSDMNEMVRVWLGTYWKDFHLTATRADGTQGTAFVMEVGNIVRADILKFEERIFHTIFNYHVEGDLDLGVQHTVPIITEVITDTNPPTPPPIEKEVEEE